ncbi:MAG: Transcriptional regulatory protein ZraR [Ignavibacteriaceae bacterium]|nr:Transcriptional regulatory protein ZraR [Ignavibacteriaceae bacterium]
MAVQETSASSTAPAATELFNGSTPVRNVSLLIVDDELSFLRSLRRLLWEQGYEDVNIEQNPDAVIPLLAEKPFDLIILDVNMPGLDGLSLLERIVQQSPEIPVIMLTAIENVKTAFNAIKTGAYDYIIKPPDLDRLFITMQRALEKSLLQKERDWLRSETYKSGKEKESIDADFSDIITGAPQMKRVFQLIKIFAPTNETILITGETGTGKDLIARKIHDLSPRSKQPFVPVNLASISPSLFESELFGHEKGSFTGAHGDKTGFFESANNGTLFLDEIGELPKDLQGKLLRVIQYNEIYRIGSTRPVKLNTRIIAATNKELLSEVQKNEFRADLYYRLNRGYIHLPPLRERGNDPVLLARHFLSVGERIYNKILRGFTPEAQAKLQNYSFPGNIRELENVVLNAAAQAPSGGMVSELMIPAAGHQEPSQQRGEQLSRFLPLEEAMDEYIRQVLQAFGGNQQKAAFVLGISERTLQRKIKKSKELNG